MGSVAKCKVYGVTLLFNMPHPMAVTEGMSAIESKGKGVSTTGIDDGSLSSSSARSPNLVCRLYLGMYTASAVIFSPRV